MDGRTKILTGLFSAFIAYALVSGVFWPRWVKPMLTIDERVAETQQSLDALEEGEAEVRRAKWEYRQLLDRIGSFDPSKIENDLRERINVLVAKHRLEDVSTSGGSGRATSFGRTDAKMMTISVNAVGTLEAAIAFLKDLAELPYLARLGTTVIYPSRSSRRGKSPDRMNLRVPIEVLVLPQQRILGTRLAEDDLKRPAACVRHQGRRYTELWERTPFTEYVELKPLIAKAGRDSEVDLGAKRASLTGTATGGDGEYTIEWAPDEGLSDSHTLRPTIDTSSAWERSYTLTVTDGRGETATDQVTVSVREKPAQVAEKPDEPKPEPKPQGPERFKDARQMQLCMALIRREGDSRMDEVMIYNSRSKQTSYYKPGDEFDGGELVFVHPRGAVARRRNGYYVYPIGAKLSDDIPAESAGDYPTLQRAANWFRELELSAPSEEPVAEAESIADADEEPGDEPAAKLGETSGDDPDSEQEKKATEAAKVKSTGIPKEDDPSARPPAADAGPAPAEAGKPKSAEAKPGTPDAVPNEDAVTEESRREEAARREAALKRAREKAKERAKKNKQRSRARKQKKRSPRRPR